MPGPSIYDFKFQFHNVGGNRLDFEPSDEDTAGDVKYYGFVSSFGSWIIMKMDTTTPTAITYRYAAGKSAYATYWSQRATPGAISYDTFDKVNASL